MATSHITFSGLKLGAIASYQQKPRSFSNSSGRVVARRSRAGQKNATRSTNVVCSAWMYTSFRQHFCTKRGRSWQLGQKSSDSRLLSRNAARPPPGPGKEPPGPVVDEFEGARKAAQESAEGVGVLFTPMPDRTDLQVNSPPPREKGKSGAGHDHQTNGSNDKKSERSSGRKPGTWCPPNHSPKKKGAPTSQQHSVAGTESDNLTGWSAALAAALKRKSKALDDQPHSSSETVFDQLELKPAPDDESERFPEILHIANNLEKRHILITGVTGFLAKVLVEKILRTQPAVGQLYLLIRAGGITVEERVANAIFGTSLFKPLREEYGDEKFVDFIVSKVTPVAGDIARPDLNLRPADAQMLKQNLNVIISSAATTKFDERYDTAIEVNTLGPLRLLYFAKQCPRVFLYQHISTAYVNGKRTGVSKEVPFEYGQSLLQEISQEESSQEPTVYPQLDPEMEAQLAFKMWEDMNRKYPRDKNDNPHPQAVKEIVKLGTERAQMFGWQDTYTLTKAMGEQMIMKHKGNVPVVIIRPSVVESTLRQPFDGWIEGQRMLDPIVAAYGKGQLRAFLADPETILDVIPADIVVNVVLAAMAKHGGYKQRRPFVYQVASSASNPLTMRKIADVSYDHFRKYPMILKGHSKNCPQAIKEIQVNYVVFLKSEAMFRLFVYLFLGLPLQLLTLPYLENDKRFSKTRVALKYQLENISHLANTYKPYVFYKGRFDATNSEKLFTQVSREEQELFGYSVKNLDWYTYLNNSHLPGLRQHVLNWKQTGRFDPNWTIIDPPPQRDLRFSQIRPRPPSRGLFQLPIRRNYNDDELVSA